MVVEDGDEMLVVSWMKQMGQFGERWIGNYVIVGSKLFTLFEFRGCQSVPVQYVGRRKVVQDHVHASQTGRGDVLLLTF